MNELLTKVSMTPPCLSSWWSRCLGALSKGGTWLWINRSLANIAAVLLV